MWDGVGGDQGKKQVQKDEERKTDDHDEQSRQATASALAAFASQGVDAARMQYFEQQQQQQPQGYDFPSMSQFAAAQTRAFLFPSHATVEAVETLRRQEEAQRRQRAIYELQQRQAMQRQELQELEIARRLQQQRVAELVSRSSGGHPLVHPPPHQQEGMSILEAIGAASSQTQLRHQDEDTKKAAVPSHAEPGASGTYVAIAPRGKPEAMATAIAAAGVQKKNDNEEGIPISMPAKNNSVETAAVPSKSTPTKKSKKRKASTSPGRSRRKAVASSDEPSVQDPVPRITDVEYENVVNLMEQFCKVPLLSEFSRPVSLLHPEVSAQCDYIVPVYENILILSACFSFDQ